MLKTIRTSETHTVPETAYLSLGSNLGDRERYLREALLRLGELGTVTAISSLYETEPVEYTAQPWFLNCCVALATGLTADQLLTGLLQIERKLGRDRSAEQTANAKRIKGPRTVDLDIVLFGATITHSATLNLPHPDMQRRRFVLEPLAELVPDLRHPTRKRTIRELVKSLPPQGVRKTDFHITLPGCGDGA